MLMLFPVIVRATFSRQPACPAARLSFRAPSRRGAQPLKPSVWWRHHTRVCRLCLSIRLAHFDDDAIRQSDAPASPLIKLAGGINGYFFEKCLNVSLFYAAFEKLTRKLFAELLSDRTGTGLDFHALRNCDNGQPVVTILLNEHGTLPAPFGRNRPAPAHLAKMRRSSE
jgi:hypothetical protein